MLRRRDRLIHRFSLAAAIVSTLLLTTSVRSAARPDPDSKINRWLIDAFVKSSDGTAPFFIVFRDRTPLSAAHRITDWEARGRFVVESLETTATRSQNGVRGYLDARGIEFTPFWVVNQIYIPSGTLELARDLARRPEVAAIVPEEVYQVPPSNPDAIEAIGWNISRIGADLVWNQYGNQGSGMVVANIDTGVQYDHPALTYQYRGNLHDGTFSHSGNWYDPTRRCTGGVPCDNNGHGTHTMGTMVGDGGIGVAPGAQWIACKGCATSSCASSSLTACAQWILAPGGDSNKRPDVVNNSWGGGGGDSWYQSYVQSWAAAGIFPAFSAGNSGPSCGTAGSPGDYPESFASGATDSDDGIASFSSRGPSIFGVVKPDVSAPGVSVVSSVPRGSYASYSGTSMASPHTAGAVALLWAIRPSYAHDISATRKLLQDAAFPLTTGETCGDIAAYAVPNNTYGSGRLNVKAAVDAGGGAVNLPPTIRITTPDADGEQFECGTAVEFGATATDSSDGDLSPAIQWSIAGASIGTGPSISKTFDCTNELGNRVVTASVTDRDGLTANDSLTVIIVNPNAPAAPSNLTATNSPVLTVNLTWTDNSNNEDGFHVYRRHQVGKVWNDWTPVATVKTNAFADQVTATGKYQYYVKAYLNSMESNPSNTASVNVRR